MFMILERYWKTPNEYPQVIFPFIGLKPSLLPLILKAMSHTRRLPS